MTAEATLRAAVLKRINEDYPRRTSGVLVFGQPAGASTGPGHPDLIGVVVGRFLALEIKVAKGIVSPLQAQRIRELRAAGAYAWVVRTTLEASKAIYQAKIGVHHPMANEPIDFDEWFKEVTSTPATPTAPVGSIASKAPETTEADSVALDMALDLDEQAAVQPDPAPEPEMASVKRRRKVKPAPPEPTSIQAQADADQQAYLDANERRDMYVPSNDPAIVVGVMSPDSSQAILVELIKAVGDRVTEVYEQGNGLEDKLNHLIVELEKLRQDFDALMEDES